MIPGMYSIDITKTMQTFYWTNLKGVGGLLWESGCHWNLNCDDSLRSRDTLEFKLPIAFIRNEV